MDAGQFPLTFQQEFFLQGMGSGHFLNFRGPSCHRICGRFDVEILKRSIDELARRHSALRSKIVGANGDARQYVCGRDSVSDLLSMEILAPRGVDACFQEIIKKICRADIDLQKEGLFKARILELSNCERILILEIHHLINDVHSHQLLLRDLWRIFLNLYDGHGVNVEEVPQYSDYAVRQRQEAAVWNVRHAQYWKDQRSKFSRIRWPREAHLSAASQPAFRSITFSIDRELTSRLRALARQERKPLAVVVLAIYAVAVAQISDMDEFVLPINLLGRHHSSDSLTVGYFAYVLCLLVHVGHRESFRDQLERIYQDFRVALAHQDFGRVAAGAVDVMTDGLFSWIPASRGEFGGEVELKRLQKRDVVASMIHTSIAEMPVPRALKFLLYTSFIERADDVEGVIEYLQGAPTRKFVERVIDEITAIVTYAVDS